MTSLVEMLRANGSWEADAAAAKIARLESALEETGNALLSQIETSSELADRVVKLEKALAHIYAWYPINVAEPFQTIHEIRDFAREVLSSGPGETPAS
jgi:hypothetical protein